MAKITRSQISEKDPFGEVKRSAMAAKDEVKVLQQTIEMIGQAAQKIKGGLGGIKPNSSANLKKINAETEKANTIAKERERLQKRLNILNSTRIDQNTELKVLIQEQNKTNKQLAREKLGLISAYQKESKRLIDLRNQYKNLAVQNKENTREGRRLLKEVTKLDAKLKQIDRTVGQSQRNVGNYTGAIEKLRGGFTRLAGALGLVGGFMLLRRGISNAVETVAGFEQSMANIKSVIRGTAESQEDLDKKMTAFAKKAREVGAATQFSANEVAGLQFELSKLGLDADIILNSTEDIANFAAATGADLPRAAELAGSALRAFNLDADQMQRVVSVLGVSTARSALDFEKLNASLSTVAPVAASFGFSIEDTVSLLGNLSNAGFDASSAATATRNILLKLADANGDLAQALGRPVKNSEELAEGLKELEARGVDLNTALELTDRRSVAAFSKFIAQAEGINELRVAITDVNDELQQMAEDRIETLQGDILKLGSRWNEWLLGVNDGTNGLSRARRAVQFLTRNLEKIIRVVKIVAISWASWKLGAFVGNVIASTKGLAGMARSLIAVRSSTNAATMSQRQWNTAVRSNPWGLLASVIATAIALVWDLATATDAAASAQNQLNIQLRIEAKIIEKRNQELEARLTEIDQATNRRIANARKLGKTEKEVAKIIEEGLQSQRGEIEANIEATSARISTLLGEATQSIDNLGVKTKVFPDGTFETEITELTLDNIIAIKQQINELDGKTLMPGAKETAIEQVDALFQLQKRLREVGTTIIETNAEITKPTSTKGGKNDPNTRLKELKKQLKANRLELELYATESTKANDAEVIRLNAVGMGLQANIKRIEKLLKLEKEKEELDPKRKERIALLGAELKAQRALADIDELGRGNIDEAKILRDLEVEQSEIKLSFLNKELKKKEEILMTDFNALSTQTKLFEEVQKMRVEALKLEEKIRDARFEETQESLRKEELDLEIEFLDRKLNGRVANAEEIAKAEIKMKRKIAKAEKEIEDELLFGDLSAEERIEAIEKFEKKVAEARAEFYSETVNRKTETDAEIEEAEKELNKKLIELQIERLREKRILYDEESEEYKKLTKEIFELQKQSQDLDKKSEEELQESFERRRAFVDVFTQAFIEDADRRIAKINEEIQAAQRQANVLEGLAASGNITARESLAEQDQIIAEANRRKEELEKRKQRILLVSSILQAYNAELENDKTPSEAFASAITNTEVLSRFVAALPTFFDGIEDTGTHGQGVDGRGGFHAILHPNERVMTAKQNAKMQGVSNEEVAAIVEQYRYGQFIPVIQAASASDGGTEALGKKLDAVQKAIEDKPVPSIELAEITQAAMIIRKTEARGNRVTHSNYKVN